METTNTQLEEIIYDVFLPPRLPDQNTGQAHEGALIEGVILALAQFASLVDAADRASVRSAADMMKNLKKTRGEFGVVDQEKLLSLLQNLVNDSVAIPLHVKAQNAAILIRKSGQTVVFEGFELTPPNANVNTTEGRLRRSFPDVGVAVSLPLFGSEDFQEAVASTIAKMSHQVVHEMNSSDSGNPGQADRDGTTNPCLVTGLLFSFFLANGTPSKGQTVWKNTREEATLSEGKKSPWRRSAVWLLVRVVLHGQMSAANTGTQSDTLYKRFMIFYMSQLLNAATLEGIQSDMLYAMNAKLARRLTKLDLNEHEAWMPPVHDCMRAAANLLESRFKDTIEAQASPMAFGQFSAPEVGHDVAIRIPDLDDFLKKLADPPHRGNGIAFSASSRLLSFSSDHFPAVEEIQGSEPYEAYNLHAFENWVARDLDAWVESHAEDAEACSKLKHAISQYHKIAKVAYQGSAEGVSAMILTILDLWVAIDKIALAIHPELASYDHDIPLLPFESLLLRFEVDMNRLFRAERYLKDRSNRADNKTRSAVFGFGQNSFSAHKAAKLDELQSMQSTYQEHMRFYATHSCDEEEIRNMSGEFETRHSHDCERCRHKNDANSLNVAVFEWPLPANKFQVLSLVFEMAVPPAFSAWRDATVIFLADLLEQKPPPSKSSLGCKLGSYQGLSKYCVPGTSDQRVTVASETKGHAASRPVPVNAETLESDVCLANGMKWRCRDTTKAIFLGRFGKSEEVAHACTLQLPSQSSSLQEFLCRKATPNTAITRQADCPSHMSLSEFRALGSLLLGHRIQWMNMLKKTETVIFALQLAEQAGPSTTGPHREPHDILGCDRFATAILDKLQSSLKRVEENWESHRAVWAFIVLAARLLSLGPEETRHHFLGYLAQCREACTRWLRVLRDKASSAVDNTDRADYLGRSLEVALVCLASFDVDNGALTDILGNERHAATYIECSICVQETQAQVVRIEDFTLRTLEFRWKRLALRALHILTESPNRSRSIDIAIGQIWRAYSGPGSLWELEANCWAVTNASGKRGNESIYLNLLTAELLVNGRPVSWLPAEYEAHADYQAFFGSQRLDVRPCGQSRMQFSVNGTFNGYHVLLTMENTPEDESRERDLILRALKDGATYDLVPTRVFKDKLPWSFVDDFVHVHNSVDGSIEFRPKSEPWISRETNWRLRKCHDRWRFTNHDNGALVDPWSRTAHNVVAIFHTIEEPSGIHLVYYAAAARLHVHIPRLKLDFYIEARSTLVRSRQFRGMVVDSSQDVETLIGLKNKLLLCQESQPLSRMILIPEGDVSCRPALISDDVSHVLVEVDFTTVKRAQLYHLDHHLGRLVGNGSLQSKLFLAHIHALTSFCLPDPFTGMTGTEQALKILQGAEVRSFDTLSTENVDTLARIAKAAPRRCHQDSKRPGIQVVAWAGGGLSPLAQHPGLFEAVKSLFDQATETQFLYPHNAVKVPDWGSTDRSLLNRDAIRSSTFRGPGFGAEAFTSNHDRNYSPKERELDAERAERALRVCSILKYGSGKTTRTQHRNFEAHVTKALSSRAGVQGPRGSVFPTSEFQYDSTWLGNPSDIFPSRWCPIHKIFPQRDAAGINRFHLMIWMSTIAFARESNDSVTQALLGMTSMPELGKIRIPDCSSFDLYKGKAPRLADLSSALREAAKDFDASDEAKGPALPRENAKAAKQRRRREFRDNQKQALATFAKNLQEQWPASAPVCPQDKPYTRYFDCNAAMRSVGELFRACKDNVAFSEYLGQIGKALKSAEVSGYLPPSSCVARTPYILRKVPRVLTVATALEQAAAIKLPSHDFSSLAETLIAPVQTPTSPKLPELLDMLHTRAVNQEVRYVEKLRESVSALGGYVQGDKLVKDEDDLQDVLQKHLLACRAHFERVWSGLKRAARPCGNQSRLSSIAMVAATHHWPRLTISVLLEQLNRHNRDGLSSASRELVTELGMSLTRLQQAERLVGAAGHEGELVKEIQNQAPRNWCPLEHPDSLLLEIEGGLRIRHVQEKIASLMRDPPRNKNSVLQLNMGEGKSSVVVPIVAASVADGSRLARVIVAKPQSRQMFEMLVSKMGGLIGRRVYHLPFTRTIKIGEEEARVIDRIARDCRDNGGIMLVQPEHILSFQLMAIQCRIINDTKGNPVRDKGKSADLGQLVLDILNLFNTNCRDIVDESDENFSVKFELVYTMGRQRQIEFAPDRWVMVQEVLGLIPKFAKQIGREAPLSVEIDNQHPGRFPRIRLLDAEAGRRLCRLVAAHICHHGLAGLAIGRQPGQVKDDVLRYVTEKDVDPSVKERVEKGEFWRETTKNGLLLLRGILAMGVLSYALGQKRWMVNFGLDPNRLPRTRLAVPYRAKDMPTPRSEFSHPELQIVLTCLSYYYGGLSDEDLFASLEHVSKSDQASGEYQIWVSHQPSLPEAFGTLDGVNIRDREQCVRDVFPALRYSKGAVDYFLSRIVFPREVKEYPHKLSASGWDIGRAKTHPTTAFSGTNDSRHILPLEMHQMEEQSQSHTDALVLNNLLAEDNSVVLLSELGHTGLCTGLQLLEAIVQMEPQPRVILDVGAQVLELSNEQVARAWLQLLGDHHQGTEAAVFCNDEDDIKQSMPLWAAQGSRFERQKMLWQQAQVNGELQMDQDLAGKFLEDEAQSLESRYRPGFVRPPSIADVPCDGRSAERIAARCREFGSADQTAGVEEQQERELVPEMERERQVERVERVEPAGHRISPNVKRFIQTGRVPANDAGFLDAFETLRDTSAGKHFDVAQFPHGLRVTADFARTLQGAARRESGDDAFQRAVQFVLTSHNADERRGTVMVVISPYEADGLLNCIRASTRVVMHLYAPRQNQSCAPLDGLDLYSVPAAAPRHPIPPSLCIQLNLFAGQLYLASFAEYTDMCDYLCLSWGDAADAVAVDGFVEPRRRVRAHRGMANFADSPVQFLRTHLEKTRRDGSAIDKTHLGRMLAGLLLTDDDFARPKRKADELEQSPSPRPKRRPDEPDGGSMFVDE